MKLMNAIISVSLVTLLSGFALAATHDNCQSYVVIVSPKRTTNPTELSKAWRLLKTPGLPIQAEDTYSGNGKIYLIEMRTKMHVRIIDSLNAIRGVIVSCESFYDSQPRLTGSN